MIDDIERWRYRYENFDKAFALLREGLEMLRRGELNQIGKEGLVQRYEFSFELAWKTMGDYLKYTGIVLPVFSPREVIRKAFETGIIGDGQSWMNALEARNLMSHTYDAERFDAIVKAIDESYFPLLESLRTFFEKEKRA